MDPVKQAVSDFSGRRRPAFSVQMGSSLRGSTAIHDAIYCGTLVNNGVQNILVNQQAPEDDAGACECFFEWLKTNGYRPVSCNGILVMYDPDEGIYRDRSDHKGLRRLLRKACLGEYSTSTNKQDALFKQLDDLAEIDPTFFDRADASVKNRLAFANGVWDFQRCELLPFSPDIILFHKLPHSFPETEQEWQHTNELARQIRDRVLDPIWTCSAEFVMQNTARAAAGCVEDRTYHFGIGDAASGKGVWMDIVSSALTSKQVGIINSGNILRQRRAGDQAKNNSWLCACRDNLVNFTSEIQVGSGVFIDGNKVKELANGGKRLTGRQNHQDEYAFRLKGLPWSFGNDIPPIKPTDSAVWSRVRVVPMEHTFLLGEEYEARKGQKGVLLGDEGIKQWVLSPPVGAAFAWMLTQAYVPHKVGVPQHVSTETKEWLQENDQDSLLASIIGRGKDGDFLSCSDLLAAVMAAGMEVSKVKLGRLMHKQFGIKSATKKIEGKTCAGYFGVVLTVSKRATQNGIEY